MFFLSVDSLDEGEGVYAYSATRHHMNGLSFERKMNLFVKMSFDLNDFEYVRRSRGKEGVCVCVCVCVCMYVCMYVCMWIFILFPKIQ